MLFDAKAKVTPVVEMVGIEIFELALPGTNTHTGVESHALAKVIEHEVADVKVIVPALSFPVTANPAHELAVGGGPPV